MRLPRLPQRLQVARKTGGVYVHEAVRAKGGQHREAVLLFLVRQQLVVGKVARRVVRGAQSAHAAALDKAARAEVRRGQLGVGPIPDLLRVGAADAKVYVEEAAQLQMAPLVDGVAYRALDGVDESQELRVAIVPAYHVLRRAVRPHEAPLVMVAKAAVVQPRLCQVLIALVLVDLPRHQVAVVVDDGHVFRVAVVEPSRPRTGEQEVIV